MNRIGTSLVVAAIVLLLAALLVANGHPLGSLKRAINPPGTAEGLPFSNGILVGDTLYVAGQEGSDDGKLRPGGIGPETQAALENIKKIVQGAGMQMSDVVSVNVYLSDLSEFGEMNNVYKTFFSAPRPARATVQVAALVNHAHIEIAAIAVKSH